MPSSISNSNAANEFARTLPDGAWHKLTLATAVILLIVFAGWEITVRQWGYAPTLNDNPYLWSTLRDGLKNLDEHDIVIAGSSRALFDLRLDLLKDLTGREPVQLSIVGSSPKLILQDIIETTDFNGTLIVGVTPVLFFAPGGPPMESPTKWLQFYKNFSPSQRVSHYLGVWLQQRLAFIQQEDLTLTAMLENIDLGKRPKAMLPPRYPPYLNTMQTNRQAALIQRLENDTAHQDLVKGRWKGLFGMAPKAPQEVIDGVIDEYVQIVEQMRLRGGQVIFIRPPSAGWLLEWENELTPRSNTWDLLLQRSGAPGFHFEDYPEQRLDCPEWSHISESDSIQYTKSLVPLIKSVLK